MLKPLIQIARPTQWLKNLIVFAALIFAGEAAAIDHVLPVVLAFFSLCFLSSGLYTINDIFDREQDQQHPIKKNRPLASGKLSSSTAMIFALILLAAGFSLAFLINTNFLIVVLIFTGLNFLYSIALKKIVIIDVMSIAISFTLRVFAGAVAVGVPASKWMLVNTLLLALFLGFGKRRHELMIMEQDAASHRKILDKYSLYLLDQLIGVVTPAVVVVYIIYTFSGEVAAKLGTEYLYLTIPFVAYGIFRYLYLIHKEEKGGSPTSVLISDKPIILTIVLWIITAIAILYL